MSKVDVIYEVQVHEGTDYIELEREIGIHEVPTGNDLVDLTPLSERESNKRLLFRVMPTRVFCHADVNYRERVRVRLYSIHAGSSKRRHLEPDAALLEEHGFIRVRAS
jgi:hypothetical protein